MFYIFDFRLLEIAKDLESPSKTKFFFTFSDFSGVEEPSIFILGITPSVFDTRPFARRVVGLTTSPSLKFLYKRSKLIITGLEAIDFKKFLPLPRNLGSLFMISLISGLFFLPARAFCPFV